MMHKTLLLAISTTALFAAPKEEPMRSPNGVPRGDVREWTITSSTGLGYYNDRQHLSENIETISLKNLSSVQLSLSMEIAWERLFLKLWGDYSWLAGGHTKLPGRGTPFPTTSMEFPSAHLGSGYSADIAPAIGCRVKFWTFGKGNLSFIPLLAYKYAHFNVWPRGQVQNSLTTLEYTRGIQQDWFGPLFEGRIGFAWDQKWHLDFFYQYQPLNFRQTLEQSVSNYYSAGLKNTTLLRISSHGDSLRMQLGGTDLSYRSPNHWQIGTHFEGSSIWSNTAKSIVRTKTQSVGEPSSSTAYREQLAVEWVRYLVNIYASHWF